ncbi:Sperm-tail PG-rich repeat [Carpediemonas membranifera]|uniref:Sperm-tail PG-rich repeat n=1 Tax=Carpediemonas membranifera TaxID=201153 RepID=A0A8J6E3S0_9EUKA|nr:Sperm-tail PG-rich repeat [Carpediemonas membranifera]|eukprot:KAG9393547.1 Sperm-tail PG-rich repeat [Carpediemonas membranifera]
MAHIVRSKRDLTFTTGKLATGEQVGPGSYDPDAKFHKFNSGAPFRSTTRRDFLDMSAQAELPGPGTYTSSPTGSAGAVSLSKSARFAAARKDPVPGPGQYESPGSINSSKGPSFKPHDHQGEARAVQWVRQQTAPSIPRGAQSFGYDETPSRVLIQQGPPQEMLSGDPTNSVGPGQYELGPTPVKRAAKSASWARSQSNRGDYIPNRKTPGVGDYNVAQSSAPLSASANFKSSINRFKNTAPTLLNPGPGEYEVSQPIAQVRTQSAYQGFGHAQRDCARMNGGAGPGPGSYDVHVGEVNGLMTSSRLKYKGLPSRRSGVDSFNSSAPRFSSKKPAELPGPGSYEPRPVSRPEPARLAPFGRTTGRFSNDTKEGPDPGAYYQRTPAKKPVRASAAFADRSSRFEGPTSLWATARVDRRPAPMYELVAAINEEHGRQPAPHSAPPARRVPFGSTQPSDRNSFLAKGPRDIPGPGEYMPDKPARKTSVGLSRSARFNRGGVEERPGPGYYYTEGSTMVKRSFNVTIDRLD